MSPTSHAKWGMAGLQASFVWQASCRCSLAAFPLTGLPLDRRSLAHLFACDPECAAKNKERQQLSRALQFAGSQLDHELELKKLQVRSQLRQP